MTFSVAPEVSLHVVAGVLRVDDVAVTGDDAALGEAMQAGARTAARSADRADVVSAVRGMYRRFGVDPTRTRPSSEALLRRVRKGDPLPRINTLVDVGNWCSLETQLPFGTYDADAIRGDVHMRVGANEEAYAGIRKDVVHVGGRLTLVDADGPFGNPSSDSSRTMVTDGTHRATIVIFTPRSLGAAAARAALRLAGQRVVQFAGGRVVAEDVW
jgi:DNA/RNA-binding domain of Phe-tRNA-synthetase-like protein